MAGASIEATLELWASSLRDVKARLRALFRQERVAASAWKFLDGLLGNEPRKTGWMRAEAAGDPGPWRQQAILGRGQWDADALRDIARDYALETLADEEAVLVIDETGFLKQGKASCGVARQYTGSAGKITNCQIGVFASYVSCHGHAFIDRALYQDDQDRQEGQRRRRAKELTIASSTKRACIMPRSAAACRARMKCRPPWNRWPSLAVMLSMATPRQMTLALKVFGLNCSLKSSKSRERSSTDALMQQLFGELAKQGATGKIVRAADYNIKPGVKSDEGKGDDWPGLRRQLLAADILVIGAPIWLGQPSSIAKRVMERMDAFLDEKDERGRMPSYGKVVIAAIVGNEDGAHHTAAEILSGLIEVGFTVPSGGSTYWVGEAMGSKEYKEFKRPPKIVAKWTQMLASNTAHLARLLKAQQYPGIKGGR